MNKLNVTIPGFNLDNPIIPASGTFGFGYEFADYYDINILGTFSTKGTTLESRYGNPLPRIAEAPSGLLNSIGLQNPGVDEVITTEFDKLRKVFNKKVLANVSGSQEEDYVECVRRITQSDMVGAIELNISCPNVKKGGMAFGTSAEAAASLTRACKAVATKPLYVKLSPNVTNVVEIAKAVEEAGADGITMINTLLGMRINIKNGKPIIANKVAGYSGPAILPVAIRMVYQVYQAVNIPIIGMGGISSARDVIEMMMAGATAVQIGSANLIDPMVCKTIIEELPALMEELGIESLESIIGKAHE